MSPPRAQRTRGKSSPERLRQVDAWLLATLGPLIPGQRAVDLGLGAVPWTTVALADALGGDVVGVDNDAERVATAQRHAREGLRFLLGDFDLAGLGPVRLLRAMNLLRQYPDDVQADALRTLRGHLAPDGLLLEGTSSKKGEVWVARALWADGREQLVFGISDVTRGFAPQRLWPYLPRSLAVRRRPGPALSDFARDWERATAAQAGPAAQRFLRSVEEVGERWPFTAGVVAGTAVLERAGLP